MKLVSSSEVEKTVRAYLVHNGYCLENPPRGHGETGCDIIATKNLERVFIESIGFQDHPPTRSKEFYECFFRVISRDEDSPNDRLVIALPVRFGQGMKQRKHQYRVAWKKIGRVFNNLEVWYVDTTSGEITRHAWNNCDQNK